jgi:rRNA maturation RNase YbeY
LPENIDFERLQTWLLQVSQKENRSITRLSYVFCSDNHILEVNRKYLNHDYYTDILTFPYKNMHGLESDILISLERVHENSIKLDIPFEVELRRVILHGLLHLCGYDDHGNEQQKIMRKAEDHYLSFFREMS